MFSDGNVAPSIWFKGLSGGTKRKIHIAFFTNKADIRLNWQLALQNTPFPFESNPFSSIVCFSVVAVVYVWFACSSTAGCIVTFSTATGCAHGSHLSPTVAHRGHLTHVTIGF